MVDFYNNSVYLFVVFWFDDLMVIMVMELFGFCVVCSFGVVCGIIVCLCLIVGNVFGSL